MFVKISKDDKIIIDSVEMADKFFKRFMGLMYRKSMDKKHGLLLKPCNEIHTFGMRFSIDVVYLSKENKILKIEKDVKPNKICKSVKSASSVLELCSNVSNELCLKEGDILKIIN